MKIKLTILFLLFASYNTLFSQSYGALIGLNMTGFLAHPSEHSEDHFLRQTFGFRYTFNNSKRLKTFDLLLKQRKNKVYTSNGGKGFSIYENSTFDLTMVHLIGKVSLKEFHKLKYMFYLDGGVSVGFVANHKFENRRTEIYLFSTPPSMTITSNDLNDFLNKMEFGVVFDLGVIRPLNSSIDLFSEMQLGASFFTGKEDYTKALGTVGFRVGVLKLIESE